MIRHVLAFAALTTAALTAASPASAGGGFINNGQGWTLLSPEAKAAYVQGLNDTANYIYVNDDLPTAIVKLARTRCIVEQKTTTAVLADRITTAYAKDPRLLSQPPLVIYIMRMGDVCRGIINEERARFSLPPQ